MLQPRNQLSKYYNIAIYYNILTTQLDLQHSVGNAHPRNVTSIFTILLFYLLDELYNDLVDFRDIFLEQNEVLNNQMMYVNQRLNQDDE